MAVNKTSSKVLSFVNSIKDGMIVKSHVYNEENSVLKICFCSGKEIVYQGIAKDVYDDFLQSENQSDFVSSFIIGKYPSKKTSLGDDEDAYDKLLKHMEPIIRSVCKKYYLVGKDYNDIFQEARISLLKAAQDFNETFNTSFENFAARICVQRRIFTEIKKSTTRQKSIPLNTSTSLDAPVVSSHDDGSSQTICDLIEDPGLDPLQRIIECEDKYYIMGFLDYELTELEAAVLEGYEYGDPYKEIADNLKITVKCVDNSLGRIRKKANRLFEENEIGISTVIYRSKKRK